jgi:hypothetical protein
MELFPGWPVRTGRSAFGTRCGDPGRINCLAPLGKAGKEPRMNILISILITFLVIILVLYLINMLPLDGRAKHIARVIVIVIGIISMLKYLAVF